MGKLMGRHHFGSPWGIPALPRSPRGNATPGTARRRRHTPPEARPLLRSETAKHRVKHGFTQSKCWIDMDFCVDFLWRIVDWAICHEKMGYSDYTLNVLIKCWKIEFGGLFEIPVIFHFQNRMMIPNDEHIFQGVDTTNYIQLYKKEICKFLVQMFRMD
jgi:hypothetical protein